LGGGPSDTVWAVRTGAVAGGCCWASNGDGAGTCGGGAGASSWS